MMKKVFALLLAAIVVCSLLTACNGGGPEEPTAEELTGDHYDCTVLNSFEDWQRDIDPLIMYHQLGRMKISTDKDRVTDGEKSLAIYPIIAEDGYKVVVHVEKFNYTSVGMPGFKQRLEIIKNQMDETDLSKMVCLSADVYNEYDVATEFRVYVDFKNYSICKKFILEPNVWTKIDFNFDPSDLASHYDTDKASYVRFEFEAAWNKDLQQIVYLDNLRLYRTAEVVEPNTITYTGNKLLDFSDPAQKGCVYPYTSNDYYEDALPTLRVTGDYADIMGEGSCLAIDVPHIVDMNPERSFSGIIISNDTLVNSGFTSISSDTARLSFNLYNDSPSQKVISVQIQGPSGNFYVRNYKLPAYSTLVFDESFAKLNSGVGEGNTWLQGTGSATTLRINWLLFEDEDATFVLSDMMLTDIVE